MHALNDSLSTNVHDKNLQYECMIDTNVVHVQYTIQCMNNTNVVHEQCTSVRYATQTIRGATHVDPLKVTL